MEFEDRRFGFLFGPAEITRIASDDEKGWIVLGLKTAKTAVQIYVTKTGKVRVHTEGGHEWKEKTDEAE